MRDLIERTGVSRESIHFYTREGMLPEIKKPSPNQAIYNEKHVERILFIKKLQERHYLPIPLIKEILDRQKEFPFDENLLDIKSDYFMTRDHLLPTQIEGENNFKNFTGISTDRLADFESYGIITFKEISGKKTYPHESVKIGKLIGDMRKRGLSHENGFPRATLKEMWEMLLPIVEYYKQIYKDRIEKLSFKNEEKDSLTQTAIELIPLFLYYMSRNSMQDSLNMLKENKNKQ